MIQKKIRAVFLLTLCCAGATWAASVNAANKATPEKNTVRKSAPELARVNDESVSLALFELMLEDQIRAGAQDSPALRNTILRDLVLQTFLAQQAIKDRSDEAADVPLRIESARKAVLAAAWQQQWLRNNPATDADIQKEDQEMVARSGNKEYQIRQVLVRDETAARLVLDQVKSGRKLEDLARSYSIEARSRAEGGLLPWVNMGSLIAPLGEVVSQAKVGQLLAEPVKTAAGWHVLELLGERPFVLPSIEKLKPQLQQVVQMRKLEAAIQADINKAKIELR